MIKSTAPSFLRLMVVFILAVQGISASAQNADKQLLIKLFQNSVFVKESGQFERNAREFNVPFSDNILYGVENAAFNAYFTAKGIVFLFPEWKKVKNREEIETEESERKPGRKRKKKEERIIETVWHSASMTWQNSNPSVTIVAEDKAAGYYNYDNLTASNNKRYDFVPAFKKLKYIDLYPGVDVEFELPEEGGIKYKIIVKPSSTLPSVSFKWDGLENIALDEKGNLLLKSRHKAFEGKNTWNITDHAPTAFSSISNTTVPVVYELKKNIVTFKITPVAVASSEGFVIDPWITNTSFPDLNKAFDIQEDAQGNVIIIGNHSNWQVQKYDPGGTLLWTYVTYAVLMGDIAVDNPGNVYIIGGYSAGKRQKLDTSGVQLWQFSGLVEEWRLAFNYSKTVLAIGGYFINPGNNNLAKLDLNNGAISDQIIYGEETRGLATDCNGDVYSLHVTFGYSGTGPSNQLRKTNADFTPAGALVNGFMLAEAQPAGTGYGYNPAYATDIYQVLNAITVNGPFVFIYDGATLKKIDKAALTITSSVAVPNGTVTMCGGVAGDLCGNIYVGSTVGIEKFDANLNHIQTITAPAAVYDIILNINGDLLACGNGFVGRFSTNCTPPPQLTAALSSTNVSCKGGTVTATASGGTAPYSYLWQPGGYTTATVDSLTAGTYTCTVTDPFCQTFTDTVSINQIPAIAITVGTVQKEACLNSFNGSASVSASGGTPPYNFLWNTVPVQNTPSATGLSAGIYLATVTDADSCRDTVSVIITRNPDPTAAYTSTSVCNGLNTQFTESSSSASGTIVTWVWNFGDGTPVNTIAEPQHTYLYAGTYDATLMVYDNFGCGDTLVQPVTVHYLPVAGFSSTEVCMGVSTQYTSTSTVNNSSTLSFYSWDFGDGGTSLLQNPSHNYSAAGTFPISLIVTTNNGCADTTAGSVIVHPLPDAAFSASNVCDGSFVIFNNQSAVAAPDVLQTALWKFGDGVTVSNNNASYLYTTPGAYDAKLVVSTSFGCSDSLTRTIVVNPKPVVNFSASDTTGCAPLCISFQNSSAVSSGNMVQSSWDFGDATPVTVSQDVFHCYENSSPTEIAVFTASLTVVSDSGCITSLSKPNYITVYPNPISSFSVSPAITTILDPVITLENLSVGGDVYYWAWEDTSSTDFLAGPLTYKDTGTYQVMLITTTQYNCKDTSYQTILVEPDFAFYVPNAFTPNDDGINDTFTGRGIFIKDFEMFIFDRWGNMVYKTDDINKPWDGKANDGNEFAQMDVYVYLIKVSDLKSTNYNFRGTVTLVR